ncbi:MAG: hypothetical protein ACI94Y_003475 [Maribacter sp.]|jgi:hypothetical protein
MHQAIFKDPQQQELFDKQGYIITPFIDRETVAFLDKTFDELHPNLPDKGFISGSYSADFEYKKKASDLIAQTFEPSFKRLFQNYTPFGGAFLFKVPSPESELMIHQDWSIVDENKYYALNIWVPLIDITPENGPLMVLPGSHYQKLNTLRAPTLPYFFSGHEEEVKKYLVPAHIPAGHAVVLNQSVVHYSSANNSTVVRKAITAGVKSEGAKLRLYYNDMKDGKDELEMFDQEDDFLISFEDFIGEIFSRPKIGESKGKFDYKVPSFEKEEFNQLMIGMQKNAGHAPKNIPAAKGKGGFLSQLKKFVGIGN